MTLRKAGGNWVDGDRFFDRDAELEALTERVRDGIHSGSVGLEPILQQAGLSAHANIFSPFDLKPWDEETASACLATLAGTYEIDLPLTVRQDMCRRLRCQIPHHVQQFFDNLHEDLRRANRREASLEDVDRVYTTEMLGVRGQMDLEHYESRLRMVLGDKGYLAALDILTEAAVNDGLLHSDAIDQYYEYFQADAVPVSPRIFSVCSNMTAIWRDKVTTTGSYRAYSKLGGAPGTAGTSSP